MPYKSSAQRGFFHTAAARNEGITPKIVSEWDAASKGLTNKDLPVHVGVAEKAKSRFRAAFAALHPKKSKKGGK